MASSARMLLLRGATTARTTLFSPSSLSRLAIANPIRQYHRTTALSSPYKDDQDRQSLNPRPSEGTKSGSDDEVAQHKDAAFNPDITSPEAEAESVAKDGHSSVLDASGAYQNFSKPPKGSKSDGKKDASEKRGPSSKTGQTKTKKHGSVSP
ncbi:hypothetical protein B0H63DRAFT_200805 [Podospora didyma]|uniref:Uncharacterized protein n=1 Tax=Podospora didyma TaxID=330526 RepID=A0AAE0NH18_9PEZI|nr:hypothetical protein B0H63DRAFT_200805 [Podospora didyma]